MAKGKSRNSVRSNSARTSHDPDTARTQQAATQRSRQQMATAADAASTLMRGAQAWSELQARALQRSGQTWREAAERLRAATTPLDYIGVQNHIVMNAFLQAVQFSQELMQASAALQPNGAAQLQDQAAAAAEDSMAGVMQGPMMQAWQAVMNPMSLNGAASSA